MEGLSSSFTCSWASCVSMDGSCRSQAALGGAQRQDKKQQAGGSTGRCWLGKQESEFLVVKVGIDLRMHCLKKLWDPRNVKIDWRKLQGSLAYSWVTPVLCMVLDLHKASYKHTFFSFVLFSLGFDYFLFFFPNYCLIYMLKIGNCSVCFWQLFCRMLVFLFVTS